MKVTRDIGRLSGHRTPAQRRQLAADLARIEMSPREVANRARIATAKRGRNIKVRLWNGPWLGGGSMETAATSLTNAVALIRAHGDGYEHWSLSQ